LILLKMMMVLKNKVFIILLVIQQIYGATYEGYTKYDGECVDDAGKSTSGWSCTIDHMDLDDCHRECGRFNCAAFQYDKFLKSDGSDGFSTMCLFATNPKSVDKAPNHLSCTTQLAGATGAAISPTKGDGKSLKTCYIKTSASGDKLMMFSKLVFVLVVMLF